MSENTSSEEFAQAADFPPLQPLFHEEHVLELQNYLDFFDALSNKYRFGIVYLLYTEGEMSAKELEGNLDRTSNGLHYHLRKLTELGLVQNHKREQHDDGGLYSYYRLTPVGSDITPHVVGMFEDQHETLTSYLSEDNETTDTEGIGSHLRSLLTAENPDVRRWAVASFADLANIDPDAAAQAVSELINLLDDGNRDVQVDAAQSLLRITETAPEIIPDQATETLLEVYPELRPRDTEDYFKIKEFIEHGKQIHQLLDHVEAEARASLVLADRAELFEDRDDVVEYYEEALDLFVEADDVPGQIQTHDKLADLHVQNGEFDRAITHLETALESSESAESEIRRVRILRQIGAIHRHRQDTESALDRLEEAEATLAQLDTENPDMLASIKGTKADVLRDQGDIVDADELYDEALALVGEDANHVRAQLLLSKALIPGGQGNHQRALEILQEARDSIMGLSSEGPIEFGEWTTDVIGTLANIEGNIGVAHLQLEEFDEAITDYNRSALLYIVRGDLESVLEKYDALATTAKENDDETGAIEYCNQALNMIRFVRGDTEQSFSELVESEVLADFEDSEIDRIGTKLQARAESMDPFLGEISVYFQVKKARLEDSPEILQKAYLEALEAIKDEKLLQAHQMLKIIWDEYDSIEPEDGFSEIVLSAGVALAGCLEILEHDNLSEFKDTLTEAIVSAEGQLRPIPEFFFNWIDAENQNQELVREIDDSFRRFTESETESDLTETELDVFHSMFWSLADDITDNDEDFTGYEEAAIPQGPDIGEQNAALMS